MSDKTSTTKMTVLYSTLEASEMNGNTHSETLTTYIYIYIRKINVDITCDDLKAAKCFASMPAACREQDETVTDD